MGDHKIHSKSGTTAILNHAGHNNVQAENKIIPTRKGNRRILEILKVHWFKDL